MDFVDAIAKVRFASARAQRVGLCRGGPLTVDLLCMEPGQDMNVSSGRWLYYVIKGQAKVVGDGEAVVSAGQMAATGPEEAHNIANVAEQRLVCIAIGFGDDNPRRKACCTKQNAAGNAGKENVQ